MPSVVYGLWGIGFLAPRLVPLYEWLDAHLGFIPFFAGPASATGRTIMTASIVLAVMILPIMTAICREIFLQTPASTKRRHWRSARPAGRWPASRSSRTPASGIVSAAMLGLGRALGETLAVAMVLSVSVGTVTANLISSTTRARSPPTSPSASARPAARPSTR